MGSWSVTVTAGMVPAARAAPAPHAQREAAAAGEALSPFLV